MQPFRRAIAILTLLAVATNSAAASFRPCCCSERDEEPKHECCVKEAEAKLERASYCALKKKVARCTTISAKPCCCIKSLPATSPARGSVASRPLPPIENALIGDSLMLADFPPAKQRIWASQPGLLIPAAPPITALYCIWLE